MTDTEQKRIQKICKVAHIEDIGELSDGYHTFNQLYYQRMMLFAILVKQNRDKAWKSLRHSDGELCFGGGWFIVGIDTPKGSYTYHYEDEYFDLFDCEELERGKVWDGHTEKDVIRLLSLEQQPCEDCVSREELKKWLDMNFSFGGATRKLELFERLDKELPPIQPKAKTGKWIPTYGNVKCSVCGNVKDGRNVGKATHYCDFCGAKMESEE